MDSNHYAVVPLAGEASKRVFNNTMFIEIVSKYRCDMDSI